MSTSVSSTVHESTSADRDSVTRMLRPRSIAIIGMSARPGSNGRMILHNLRVNGYAGELHLVGRSAGEIDGLPVVTDVAQVPIGVDLALLAVPGAGVREAVTACVRREVGVAVIYASGFAEFGQDGRVEQAQITRIASEGGLRLVGPNCVGFTNYVHPLNTVFLPDIPLRPLARADGRAVAVLAQSGGLMSLIQQGLHARGIEISYRLSTGNEAGLTLGDYLDFLADDPATRAVTIYAEDIRRPQSFLAAARKMRDAGKSIVLMHAGRGIPAQRAAASHTGALASNYAVIKTLASHAGVCVTESLEELTDVTELLARHPAPSAGGPAVVTTSGAFCAIALDTLDDLGLRVPPLSPATHDALTQRLPAYMKADNPLDLGTAVVADPALFHDGIAALLADESVSSVTLAAPNALEEVNLEMLRQVAKAAEPQSKPVAVTLFGDAAPLPDSVRSFAIEHNLPISMAPERTLRAMATVTRYGRQLTRSQGRAAPVGSGAAVALAAGRLSEWQGKRYLAELGVPVPAGALATTVDEAVALAADIGYPVVAKAQAPALLHKTEAGAVVLGIADEAGLREAWADLTARLGNCADAPLDGVLVETMAAPGLELVVGAKRHDDWGPVVLVGLGGVWVEALGDTRLLPPDLASAQIVDELRQLRSSALLGPYRGRPTVDVEAVAAVAATIGGLMLTHPKIDEIDINPLVARADGVTALDVLITTTEGGMR